MNIFDYTCRHKNTYNVTDAAGLYTHNCITKFEKANMVEIADVMHAFVRRYVSVIYMQTIYDTIC